MPYLSDDDREDLVAYLDGELDEEKSRTLETRLNLDPKARAEADALQQAWGMLDYLPRTEPSASFTHRTLERLALQTAALPAQRRSWGAGLAWAAAVLLAAVLGYGAAALIWRSPAEPPDVEEQLVRHLPLIEKIHALNEVDDLDFLRALDQPDLFGDEPTS
jgi:anti-sigma factor RsiW